MKVSKSVGKADNDCKMILLRWIRSSFEFIDLEAKECIQCSSFNVCCWRRWSCPRPSERLQNDSFTLDQIIIWVHWLGSKGMINVHHFMSVVGGDEGVQDRPKGMQVDLFTLHQTIIWVHALTWAQRNVFNVHHLLIIMSAFGGHEGVQDREKGKQWLQVCPLLLSHASFLSASLHCRWRATVLHVCLGHRFTSQQTTARCREDCSSSEIFYCWHR